MRIIKVWFALVVFVLVPTLWVLLTPIESRLTTHSEGRGSFYASGVTATLRVGNTEIAALEVGEISTAPEDTVLLREVSVQTDLPAAWALLAVGKEMSDLLPMVVGQGTRSNHQREAPGESANLKTWQNLRIDGVTISASDLELSAASLHVCPGRIGFLNTALFHEVLAVDLDLSFCTDKSPRQVHAGQAQWRFPIGRLRLKDGHVSCEGEGTTAFGRCEIAPQSWTISRLSRPQPDASRKDVRTGPLGLQSKVFSWGNTTEP